MPQKIGRSKLKENEDLMAEKLDPKEIVSFEELLVSSMFEQNALVNLLERKGLITKAELLEEIKALKMKQKK
jgi:hypothetical protein